MLHVDCGLPVVFYLYLLLSLRELRNLSITRLCGGLSGKWRVVKLSICVVRNALTNFDISMIIAIITQRFAKQRNFYFPIRDETCAPTTHRSFVFYINFAYIYTVSYAFLKHFSQLASNMYSATSFLINKLCKYSAKLQREKRNIKSDKHFLLHLH